MIYNNAEVHKSVEIGFYSVIGAPGALRGCKDWNGRVKVCKDVIIGANVTIAVGEKGETYIGEGTSVMNNALVGHNVKIGKNCEIGGGALVAGYAEIGDNVKIKTGAIVRNRVKIADGVIIGLGAVVVKDITEKGSVWYGTPATKRNNKQHEIP
jgi:UDP-3-O-[3-hydroxymyristoyl] glucosamine N-acyltransferase